MRHNPSPAFPTRLLGRILAVLLALPCLTPIAQAAPKPPSFAGAQWIWHQGAGEAAGTWYLRKRFFFPAGKVVKSARVAITCDNLWTLHVNGKQIGQNDAAANSWRRPQAVDATHALVSEENAISVEGCNTIPSPAGLLVKLIVQFADVDTYELVSDGSWESSDRLEKGWTENRFPGGEHWTPVTIIAPYGGGPWGKVAVHVPKPSPQDIDYPRETAFAGQAFDAGIVFLSETAKGSGYAQYARAPEPNHYFTRAYMELDAPTPAALGRKLWSLVPFKPDGVKTLLMDAGARGSIGSPTVSHDGKTVYFTMARAGEAFFHIYAIDSDGRNLRQVTDGPFQDYDPVELPDGRIAFSSTRIGHREEYHAKYASSIFACNPDGTNIRPITYHIGADREPRVMANGSLVFVRMDNFMERAKVEVHLHQTRGDGTAGQVAIGAGRGGIRLGRAAASESGYHLLRHYGVGSPAPMPDGRVAAIGYRLGKTSLVTSADVKGAPLGGDFVPFDVSALPDGRLLCTAGWKSKILLFDPADASVKEIVTARALGVRDLHSVASLQPRRKPHGMPSFVNERTERTLRKTGYLYCQDARNTQHVSADTARIKAIRVYQGQPLTLDPTQTIYAHIGTVGVELGTVPLAEDGSFYVEVPADRALALQAVDGEGRAVINELSWIYARPGEQRSCVGCHADTRAAPPMAATSRATQSKPLKLLGQGNPHRFRANSASLGGIVNMQFDKFREIGAINLYDRDGHDEISMAQRLGVLRDRAGVPALVKLLEGKSPETRCAAAIALSACGDRSAVAPLMAALKDSNPAVVNAAAAALEHLTGNRAGGSDWVAMEAALITKLASLEKQTGHMALEALGHIGGEAGAAAIRDYLVAHPKDELRVSLAAIRSLGHLKDRAAVPLLIGIAGTNLVESAKKGYSESGDTQGPVYLAGTAIESLGRIGGADVEAALIDLFRNAGDFQHYTRKTGAHGWLQGVNASLIYFRLLEALERMECKLTDDLVNKVIVSIPCDKDRGLLYELDSYEKLTARAIQRCGKSDAVVEACLSVLGDPAVTEVDPALIAAVSQSPHAQGHIRKLSAQSRAAQVLSIVCDDLAYADRIRTLLSKFRAEPSSEKRSYCCFMLTRGLGKMGDRGSVELFVDMLVNDPTETALGLHPAPNHILYKGWRPFHRPAAAWALGQLKAREATDTLLAIVKDLDNASSTREQAALALGLVGDKGKLEALQAISTEYPDIATRRAILQSIEQLSETP
ncbi:MAG: HEAT repeat domain-containing protein [Kiritimatiellae bacterium]|nr:HEAT repeat domain-containing protein [Kiritimatiellia bacterium]